MLEFMAQVLI